jgi:hypothetical protein
MSMQKIQLYITVFFLHLFSFIPAKIYTDEDLNPHAIGVLFISFKCVKRSFLKQL